MFTRHLAMSAATAGFLSVCISTSNQSAFAASGTICDSVITAKTHAKLRASTKGRKGYSINLNCHDFVTGPTFIRLTPRRDGYRVQVNLIHQRIGADDLFVSFMRITLKGRVYHTKESTHSVGPHLPGGGDWKASARRLTGHIGEIVAKDVQRKLNARRAVGRKQMYRAMALTPTKPTRRREIIADQKRPVC